MNHPHLTPEEIALITKHNVRMPTLEEVKCPLDLLAYMACQLQLRRIEAEYQVRLFQLKAKDRLRFLTSLHPAN